MADESVWHYYFFALRLSRASLLRLLVFAICAARRFMAALYLAEPFLAEIPMPMTFSLDFQTIKFAVRLIRPRPCTPPRAAGRVLVLAIPRLDGASRGTNLTILS
jgi:hypothetical protein